MKNESRTIRHDEDLSLEACRCCGKKVANGRLL